MIIKQHPCNQVNRPWNRQFSVKNAIKILLFTLVILPIAGKCDYSEGFTAFKRGDQKRAVAEFQLAVETRRFDGYEDVINRWTEAREISLNWFGRDLDAYRRVTGELLPLLGVPAEHASAELQWKMSLLWMMTPDGDLRRREQIRWLVLAADNGYPEAAWELSQRVAINRQDLEDRYIWLQRAAALGDLRAQRILLLRYFEGKNHRQPDGERPQHLKALPLAQNLANKGDVTGMVYLAVLKIMGEGIERDYDEAFRLIMRAYALAPDSGQVHSLLEKMYREGLGVPANLAEADKWRDRAIQAARRQVITN